MNKQNVMDKLRTGVALQNELEQIALLMAHLAHLVNNQMLVVGGTADLLKMKLGPQGDHTGHLDRIKTAVLNTNQFIRQMISAVGTSSETRQPCDLDEIISQAVNDHPEWGSRPEVELRVQSEAGLWETEADPRHLYFIVTALVKNALEAIESRGNVVVSTENVVIDDEWTSPDGLKLGSYVKLLVADDGVGMTDEIQGRMFDPMFSSKSSARGFELALLDRLVNRYDRCLEVESLPCAGTRFSIYFPKWKAA